ncbi:hypothetical protein HOP50_05g36600 [Chloropicon primus]|uniref:Uncharacterized protein n=1 Tax=Chloropicon primus TaxID=1764295 RepID=A0A5B8MP71_9CHLO|nr:hypothetical protein A3770_05p36500 [Chloropicon primus]UPR00346.1 hypothetical protein HOP50_05g36600 [Chloropicon primus]|eukprot:QDZ21132.1 hypothetical protein A3770_05p36500 [Chloropicon primus]
MGGKASKSAAASKKTKKKEGPAVGEREPESRRENEAWKTPTRLQVDDTGNKTLTPNSSTGDLVSLSPTSETKIEKMDLEVQEKQRNQEVVPMANLDTCVDVLEVAEELAIDRPKPPIAAFEVTTEASTTSERPETEPAAPRAKEGKAALPQLKLAPKRLNDISNIVENQSQPKMGRGPDAKAAARNVSQTPSPSSYRNIGYVSASPTPTKQHADHAHEHVLQLTPAPESALGGNHLSARDSPAYLMEENLSSKALFDQDPAGVLAKMGPASPAPVFKSVLDATDESLMQAILDAEV